LIEKIISNESKLYLEHYLHYDRDYLRYFQTEKGNKPRIDIGIPKIKKKKE
jgi:hypothetical protein